MQEQPNGSPETAREAAKTFVKPYVLDGWTLQEISKKQPRTDRPEFATCIGGGKVTDHRGQEHTISREQLAVTRLDDRLCWSVFDLAEIMAEVRDERRGYQQYTLAAIFEQQRIAQIEREDEVLWQTIAPIQQKRPAIFRAYQGGFCRNCGEPLGYIEADGGRNREFCNNNSKCRVAYHRKQQREKKREAILQYHGELRDHWRQNGIHGEVLLRLQDILIQQGKAAARDATNVVLVALAADDKAGASEQSRLMEDIMMGGERLGFEEVQVEEFYIPAGVEGWLKFVHTRGINPLRQLCGYIYDRERQGPQKAQARNRLEVLGKE